MSSPREHGLLCGHCGRRHATITEIRECSGVQPPDRTPLDHPHREPIRPAGSLPPASVPRVVLGPNLSQLAGPDALGRSLVILPHAAVPAPWADSERVVIPPGGPGPSGESDDVIARLRKAWSLRRRLVIECPESLVAPTDRLDARLVDLDPSYELPHDLLDHLVFSNSVDARDTGAPYARMIDRAVAAGASLAGSDTPADIIAADGTPLWCDGGPLEPFTTDLTLGIPVIPRVHLMAGILRPFSHGGEPDAQLAPDQIRAVTTPHAGARIIAPAGSGKTRVLTERARYLISRRGVDPAVVCLLAFNVRARQEMQERTSDLPGLEVRTLNSLALAICRGTGSFARPHDPDVRVIDERRVRDHIRALVKTPRRAMTDPFAAWIEAFTTCRLGLRDPAQVEQEFDGDVPDLPRVIEAYRSRLSQLGEVDFDEQIIRAVEILVDQPDCRRAARAACGVLLVDEFQDLTPAHLLFIRLLAGPAAAVYGVGDDDQTIYGYAGASPSWLIEFSRWFPGSASHDLQVNYRCPPEVVEAARNLLSHNRNRIPKRIEPRPDRGRTPHASGSSGHPMRRIATDDPLAALSGVVSGMLSAGVPAQHIAVLTRVNATLIAPMLTLRAAGVPTTTPVDSTYLARTGVSAALAWLRLATSPDTALPAQALEAASRRPPRGISPMLIGWVAEQKTVGDIERLAGRLRTPRDREKIEALASDIGVLRDLASGGANTARVLAAVRDTIGLGNALDTRLDASRRSLDRSSHGDDLEALLSVAGLQPQPSEFPDWLSGQLSASRDFDGEGVRLSTIHRVKGMEWPRVIVFGVDKGVLPHRLSSDSEEERRIFHVAITRSSDQTVVVSGRTPSPFLGELDATAPPPGEDELPPSPPPAESTAPPDTAKNLFEALRSWRSRVSKEAHKPAFVVFDNRTLEAIAMARPVDRAELLAVSGVGPVKLERYGDDVLEIIAAD